MESGKVHIVKITNIGNGFWLGTTHDGKIRHDCGPEVFPAAAIAATPNVNDAVYYEGIMNEVRGDFDFGAVSTEAAYAAT